MRIHFTRDTSGRLVVLADGEILTPARSQKLFNHSPDGFNVGYGGSGPAQTALAILLHAGLPDERAVRLHQRFKWEFLQEEAPFWIELDVQRWALEQPDRGIVRTE